VEHIAQWVDEKSEGTEEKDEWDDATVEELLIIQNIGELGVEDGETNGHWQVDPCLQEGDDFSTGTWSSDDKDILGISEDGIIEKDAKEHETEGDDLLPSEGGDAQELLLLWSGDGG
jgi:hypothetical protein